MAASDCLLSKNKMVAVSPAPFLNRPTLLLVTFCLHAGMNQDLNVWPFADVADVQAETLVAINRISFEEYG
jgi:hypothetical protein